MYLENIVFDAVDPQRVGRFWQELLGCEQLTDTAEGFETRLAFPGGRPLDLCFQPVPEAPVEPVRLHLDLRGGAQQDAVVASALRLGARPLDIGQGNVPWVVLGDPQGNAFCVMEERDAYRDTGPIAALPLDSADPKRDAQFWAALTGWAGFGTDPLTLRHPSRRGPLLALCREPAPKTDAKNRMHLDIRLEAGQDPGAVAADIAARGGRELHPDWGEIPWRVYQDPSGNEFCVLPAG